MKLKTDRWETGEAWLKFDLAGAEFAVQFGTRLNSNRSGIAQPHCW